MYALIVFSAIICVLEVFLIIRALFFFKASQRKNPDFPKVSVLVAARNEETSIATCIDHLLRVRYPAERIEIFVGNDQSTDRTRSIVKEYANQNNRVHLIDIEENNGGGKAKVLEELGKKASGDVLLITDADTFVPDYWVHALVGGLEEGIGIVNGITLPKASKWQRLDWLLAVGFLKLFDDLNIPVTAMGNNMLVTNKAYKAVGGYENIPFSVTEDYQLFKYVRRKGYRSRQLFEKPVLAETLPKKGLKALLDQRKRWMRGGFSTSWYHLLFLMLQASYYPVVIALIIMNWQIGLKFFLLKTILQAQLLLIFGRRIQIKINPLYALLHEGYSASISLLSLLYYFIPTGINWKGRTY